MKRKFLLIWTSLAVVLSGCGGEDDPAPGPIIPPTPETPDAEKFEVGQVMPAWAEGYMDIHSINGGRGEAFYYIFPDGTTMLVDAAGAPPNELYDYGSDAAGVDSKPNVNDTTETISAPGEPIITSSAGPLMTRTGTRSVPST